MGFIEKDLEELIVNLIKDNNFDYVHGDNLKRDYENVLLEDDLKAYLRNHYSTNGITDNEIKRIIMGLTGVGINPLYDANKTVFKKIVEGEILVRDDRTQKDFHYQLIDFDNPDRNIFKVCNQVIIKGPINKRIPDTIIYINGLPMVVWEYKSTTSQDATIHDAYVQLTTRYKRDIPELFKYNAFVVISDGVNSKMGSLFADYEHFYAWRKVEENDSTAEGIDSLYTMINGLFTRERLLDVIHNFIFFADDGSPKKMKIVCNYPQYFAATKLSKNVMIHKKPLGDGKGGTYFGSTGCGKSFGMLFTSRLIMKNKELRSPTIVLITDRTDLDEQLANNFTIAKEFTGEHEILEIQSREDLKNKLQGRTSGGIYLTTIQKFTEDLSLLSDRTNIVCISDEAHRSQVNLDQKMKITKDGVKSSYGYAKYLHDSLPNATYIGFTGTPIDETIDVFGEVVEKYTMRDSVKDGITVNLIYDGRLVKAILDQDKLAEIEKYYENALNNGANEYQVEESKKKAVSIKTIMGDHDILTNVAKCFIEHYENRVNEGSTVLGKAMFIAPDRTAAWDFIQIVKEMRPEWFVEKKCADNLNLTEDELAKVKPSPMMRMVATRGKDDPAEMYAYLGDDEDRRAYASQFKDNNSNFKIAVVVDMWLTGFDVPSLDTMYIDKLISQKHTIIQTISRINRAFPGKDVGLIVDFAGIKIGIDMALKKYADYQNEDFDAMDKVIKIVKDELDVLRNILYKFDSSPYFTGDGKQKLDTLNLAVEFIQSSKELENRFMAHTRQMKKAFNLCNGSRDFTDLELDEIHFFSAIRTIIFKLTKGNAPDTYSMNKKVQEMVKAAIIADNAEEIFSVNKDTKHNGVDLFSPEYLERINKIALPNTKVKILEQLLRAVIENFKQVNRIKGLTFSQRLQNIVDAYNERTADLEQLNEIIDTTIEELLVLAKELREEKDSFDELGINYEEKAFYDVLVSVEKKYNFDYPNEKNLELAKKIYELVSSKDKYADWLHREDIKAELQCDIIMLLSEYGFPPLPEGTIEDYEKVFRDVIDQSENFRKYYNV